MLSPHNLTLIDGTNVIGTYSLDFVRSNKNQTDIIDDASTDSDGSTLTAIAGDFLSLDVFIQQNDIDCWQLIRVEYSKRSTSNPKTGEFE